MGISNHKLHHHCRDFWGSHSKDDEDTCLLRYDNWPWRWRHCDTLEYQGISNNRASYPRGHESSETTVVYCKNNMRTHTHIQHVRKIPSFNWILCFVLFVFFFILCLLLFPFILVWVRGTVAHFCYDQLMYLAWKRFLPLLLNYLLFLLVLGVLLFLCYSVLTFTHRASSI